MDSAQTLETLPTSPAETIPMEELKTTNIYIASYLYFKGFEITKVSKSAWSNNSEVTFKGLGVKSAPLLYKNCDEKRLLDAFIKMKAILKFEVRPESY